MIYITLSSKEHAEKDAFERKQVRAGEMAQLVKGLSHKHKCLSPHSSSRVKSSGQLHKCGLVTQELRGQTSRPLRGSLASKARLSAGWRGGPAIKNKICSSRRPSFIPSTHNRRKSNSRGSKPTSGLCRHCT